MDKNMFCFQCEQTIGCSGCTGARGVCGKSSKTALLQDKLTGSLVALAEAVGEQNVSEKTNRIMIEGLFATLTNVNFDDEALEKLIETALKEKEVYASGCSVCQAPCGRMEIYEMEKVWREPDEDIKSLKSLLLFGLRGIAAYAYHAMVLGYNDKEVNRFFYKGMSALGQDRTMENLLGIVMETGAVNFKCMELLDKANTETYGIPAPAEVSLKVEKGPFIVISGHDLKDLKMLLEQTEGKGINIYTHGEMLQIEDQWYIFYHRQTNRSSYARQACAEKLERRNDGGFQQAEITSCGLNQGALKGIGAYEARIACNLWSINGTGRYDGKSPKQKLKDHPYFTQSGKDRENNGDQYIANMKNGSVAGFKYFEMGEANQIGITIQGNAKGTMQVSDKSDFENICAEIEVSNREKEMHTYKGALNIPRGKRALFFRFQGEGTVDFHSFELMKD